jgi:hypothetical protein
VKNHRALNFMECLTMHMVMGSCLQVTSIVWNLLRWLWIERSKMFCLSRKVFFSQSLLLFQINALMFNTYFMTNYLLHVSVSITQSSWWPQRDMPKNYRLFAILLHSFYGKM